MRSRAEGDPPPHFPPNKTNNSVCTGGKRCCDFASSVKIVGSVEMTGEMLWFKESASHARSGPSMSAVRLFQTISLAFIAMAVSVTFAMADDRGPKVDTTQPTPVVYPAAAQRAGEEGTVVVRVYVNEWGRPQDANIAKSSGYMDLDTAAIETALNWHFVPAIRGGSTASDWAAVQVVYKLPSASGGAPSSEEKSYDYDYAKNCIAPAVPSVPDGAAATKEQMDESHTAVVKFLAASDSYQQCLRRYIGGREDMAFFAKTTVPSWIVKQIDSQVAANQRQKEAVGKDYNDAMERFHAEGASPNK